MLNSDNVQHIKNISGGQNAQNVNGNQLYVESQENHYYTNNLANNINSIKINFHIDYYKSYFLYDEDDICAFESMSIEDFESEFYQLSFNIYLNNIENIEDFFYELVAYTHLDYTHNIEFNSTTKVKLRDDKLWHSSNGKKKLNLVGNINLEKKLIKYINLFLRLIYSKTILYAKEIEKHQMLYFDFKQILINIIEFTYNTENNKHNCIAYNNEESMIYKFSIPLFEYNMLVNNFVSINTLFNIKQLGKEQSKLLINCYLAEAIIKNNADSNVYKMENIKFKFI